MRIFLTIHFDPGTGISFALGARKSYFRGAGTPVESEEVTLLVDSVGDGMNPRSERERLIEMCTQVQGWLTELHQTNLLFDAERQKHSVQFYVWDALEARQLARVLARHIEDPRVEEVARFLIRMFPVEGELRPAEDFSSQPVTIVRSVVNTLVGLPPAFGFTLQDAKNYLDPFINQEGKHIFLRQKYGFHTELSDQIPFERAYELWQDRIMLRRNSLISATSDGPFLTREDLRKELREATAKHLHWLNDVVAALQKNHRDKLLLRKEPFVLKDEKQFNLPTQSAQMIVFSQLNAMADALENQQVLAQPIEEREANFHSIRGLVRVPSTGRARDLLKETLSDPRYAHKHARGWLAATCFEFAASSRDCRIREGDFTVILRNESSTAPLNVMWYRAAGHASFEEALAAGIEAPDDWRAHQRLKGAFQVTVGRLDTSHSPPLVVLLWDPVVERTLASANLRDMSQPMVLDPIAVDFSTKYIEKAIRKVGGSKPKAAGTARKKGVKK